MVRWVVLGFAACFRSKASLVAENLCLRQQLLVLQRNRSRPRFKNVDRCFWILACWWFPRWHEAPLIVKPETVLDWHRRGWKVYWRWRWRSRGRGKGGRRRIPAELRQLIRRMARENPLWGQQRIQAELARLGFKISARTVVKYMIRPHGGEPSPGWQKFLRRHASDIRACDFSVSRQSFSEPFMSSSWCTTAAARSCTSK